MSSTKHEEKPRAPRRSDRTLAKNQPEETAHHSLWRRALLGLGSALVPVVLIWGGGALYGMQYDLQGAILPAHGSDLELQQAIQRVADTYRLYVIRPDGVKQAFPLQTIGMRVHADSTVVVARQKQRGFMNRLQWWKPIPISLIISTDTDALQDFIAQHASVTIEPPRDASLSVNEGVVQLTDGAEGKRYGFTDPTHSILTTASTLQDKPLRMAVVAEQPAVTAEALANTKTQLENILKQAVVITVADQQVRPTAKDIADWIVLTPDQASKTVKLTVNTAKVQAYIDKLASKHNRPARTQVSLGEHGFIAGAEGVTVTNKDVAVAALAKGLLDGKGMQVDLPAKRTPFQVITASAAGKWIEVDVTTKRMFVYQNTELVRTFLVSAGAPATPTVIGTYKIYSKLATRTMTGPNADGTRYTQPNVPWVNYFYGSYAIHGNYWRPASWFGSVNSSHGCVGLRTSDAAWLYAWAPVGTTVVTHR
jgi:lipoprotein-anchoring transpeptidase ErfK/SrfK